MKKWREMLPLMKWKLNDDSKFNYKDNIFAKTKKNH